MTDRQVPTTSSNELENEQEVVCNHKPGDVWADGCCTSKKAKKATTEEGSSTNAFAPSERVEHAVEAGKEVR